MKVHSASRHLRPNCQQLGKKYKIDVLPCSRLLCKSLTKNVDEWTFVDAAVCQQREDCVKSTVVKYTFTLILISASPSLIKGNILYFYATLLICFFFFFFCGWKLNKQDVLILELPKKPGWWFLMSTLKSLSLSNLFRCIDLPPSEQQAFKRMSFPRLHEI